ncbi:MAG TPA: glucose-1-phosphate adenylyltransferase [bacterium]|nr:glucose-1-phosphate adenylyltransferase [bacterium]
MRSTLVMILAGGRGRRLHPLTKDRTKPAVPFGGVYRLIDFTLSNCANSGLRCIYVLTQYKSDSLIRHLGLAWRIYNRELGEFIDPIPAQQRLGANWYLGTADAITQNVELIKRSGAEHLFVFSGDHVYKMNYQLMLDFHREHRADATIVALEKPKEVGRQFGVAVINDESQLVDFQEKPRHPRPVPGHPDVCLTSMGVYLFNVDFLLDVLEKDSRTDSEHDFGTNIIPMMMNMGKVCVYDFCNEWTHEPRYWEDIGTLDAYWKASMGMLELNPKFNLFNPEWPLRCYHGQYPPARTVFADDEQIGFTGNVLDSMVCEGVVVVGALVKHSILSPDVRVKCYAEIEDSVIMSHVVIGKNAKIKKAIIDKEVVIRNAAVIGHDEDKDRKRFHVTNNGVVVVPKGAVVEA